jgi:hypothetical protein
MGFDGIHELILQGLLAMIGAAFIGGITVKMFKAVFRIKDPYAPLFIALVPAWWTGRYIWNYPFSWSK